MKAYTDIEQSKKLAEILPLESGDMHYSKDFDGNWFVDLTEYASVKIPKYVGNVEEHLLPCWSLAALLDIIPKEVKIKGQKYAPCLFPTIDGHWLYKLWYNSNEIFESPIAVWCDNPVDACYEMIIKLNERNLL